MERIAGYGVDGAGITSKTSYVYDGRGSVVQTVALPVAGQKTLSALPETQVKVQSFSYTAFGEQMSKKISGFGYNAEAFDAATGMINLRARQYEPILNRFGRKDILRGDVITPRAINRYLYGINSPISFVDPTGMIERTINFDMIPDVNTLEDAIAVIELYAQQINNPDYEKALKSDNPYIKAALELVDSPSVNNDDFASACLIASLQISFKFGQEKSTPLTFEETMSIVERIQPNYSTYSKKQNTANKSHGNNKPNYCVQYMLSVFKGTNIYSFMESLHNDWKKLKLQIPFSPLSVTSGAHAGLVGISSRSYLQKFGTERNVPMQSNIALAISTGINEAVKVKLPGSTQYIELYDKTKYNFDFIRQNEIVRLSQVTGTGTVFFTSSNKPANIKYGVDFAQNHTGLQLSPTSYAGVNTNSWPSKKNPNNFTNNYFNNKKKPLIGMDYVIPNYNSEAIRKLKGKYNYLK